MVDARGQHGHVCKQASSKIVRQLNDLVTWALVSCRRASLQQKNLSALCVVLAEPRWDDTLRHAVKSGHRHVIGHTFHLDTKSLLMLLITSDFETCLLGRIFMQFSDDNGVFYFYNGRKIRQPRSRFDFDHESVFLFNDIGRSDTI